MKFRDGDHMVESRYTSDIKTPRREQPNLARFGSRREVSRLNNPMFYSGQVSAPKLRAYSVT
jgi:hypothetical protein